MIKFVKFWWRYNIERAEKDEKTSLLFDIVFFLCIPAMLLLIWYRIATNKIHKKQRAKKEFWEKWKWEKEKML